MNTYLDDCSTVLSGFSMLSSDKYPKLLLMIVLFILHGDIDTLLFKKVKYIVFSIYMSLKDWNMGDHATRIWVQYETLSWLRLFYGSSSSYHFEFSRQKKFKDFFWEELLLGKIKANYFKSLVSSLISSIGW